MRRAQPITPLPLLLGLALIASQALAADFTGRVVGVSDGDTITVLHNGKGERIRLHGIDCPEKRQAFGKRAKQFTSRVVYGKVVTVRDLGKDRYGRTITEVLLPAGQNLNHDWSPGLLVREIHTETAGPPRFLGGPRWCACPALRPRRTLGARPVRPRGFSLPLA